jgi:hypothetical protein
VLITWVFNGSIRPEREYFFSKLLDYFQCISGELADETALVTDNPHGKDSGLVRAVI